MKSLSKPYIESKNSISDFKKLVYLHFPNFNIDNQNYIEDLFVFVKDKEVNGKVSFINICSEFFRSNRAGKGVSKISKYYWMSMGWSENDANDKVSSLQRSRSILTLDYWLNKGLTEREGKKRIQECQSQNSKKRYEKYSNEEISDQSVWSKQYWLNKGLSQEDAEYEVNKRNYGKREFWSSDEEYNEIKKIISKKTSNFIKNNPEKYKSFFGSVSKEESKFFEHVNEFISEINHKQFVINVKESHTLNQGIVKYDGYIKTDDGIILIEYDGLYWHNQSYDEVKDQVSLEVRSDILGIIRVSDVHYKTNPIKTLKLINNGIEKIKSKESNRIKIY